MVSGRAGQLGNREFMLGHGEWIVCKAHVFILFSSTPTPMIEPSRLVAGPQLASIQLGKVCLTQPPI